VDRSPARLIVHLDGGGERLRRALPVVQHWLDEWADLAPGPLAVTVTAGADPDDDDTARMVLLQAALEAVGRQAWTAAAPPSGAPGGAAAGFEGFEGFGAGEMAVFARAGDLDGALSAALDGVATLQDTAHVDGVDQWIIGR